MIRVSGFVFPVVALTIAVYMAVEQATGNYRPETGLYMYGLATPVAAFAVIQLLIEIRTLVSGRAEFKNDAPAHTEIDLTPLWRVSLFVGSAAAAILLLPVLGYILSFAAFLASGFLMMGLRRPLVIVALVAGTVLFVHLMFVSWLETPLPAGVLGGLV